MAFNPDLMKDSLSDPFIKHDGSCTWSEWFVLTDAACKVDNGFRRQVVSTSTKFDGQSVKVLAYVKGKDPATMLIVDSDQPDLPGMFCHFQQGYSVMKPVRYFYGDVYFDSKYLFELLQAVDFQEMPDKPGLAVPILTTIMAKLEVDVSPHFNDNVAGMAKWVRKHHQRYTYSPWATSD